MIRLVIIGILFFLLYYVQLNLYRKLWLQQLSIAFSFKKNYIFQGEQGELQEIIENKKWLPLSMLKVKFQTDRRLDFGTGRGSKTTDKYYRYDVFRVGGGERVTRTLSFQGTRRGYFVIDGADLVAADLLLTTNFMTSMSVYTELYVYPRPWNSDELRRAMTRLNGEILVRRNLLEDPFEYRGIREYQPYDSMRSINWKATAKTDELKVNLKNYTSLKYVRIFFNLQDDGIIKKEECVEAAISIVAGLCAGFLNQGLQVACYGNGLDVETGQYVTISPKAGDGQMDTIYRTLARIDLDKPPVSFTETFYEKIMNFSGDIITCFVAPNQYDDFLNILGEYQASGREYRWFYPVSGTKVPEIPVELMSHVHMIHV